MLQLKLTAQTPPLDMTLDRVDIPSKSDSNEDGTSTGMNKDQNTNDVCIVIVDNHEGNSLLEYEDQVSKSLSRPSRSQESSNEDISENSTLNSRLSETSPPANEYSSYRYPYKTTFNFCCGKKIPVLSNIIGMRCTKEILIVVSFIVISILILYSLKDPPKPPGINSEITVSNL